MHTFAGHVVPSVSIANLVQQRNGVIERLTAALELIWQAEEIAGQAHVGFPNLYQQVQGTSRSLYDKFYSRVSRDDEEPYQIDRPKILDRLVRAVDAGAWEYLMDESGLRTFMDKETRDNWREKLYKHDVAALDVETIHATFDSMYLNRGNMLEDGIVKCFKRLSWCYKTNQPFRFGSRIIIRGFSEYNHRACDDLDDLMRVFCVLDKKPEPDHRNAMYGAVATAYQATKNFPKSLENDYLSIKFFKNHNAHIKFKRAETVDAMNDMIARRFPGALPYDRGTEVHA